MIHTPTKNQPNATVRQGILIISNHILIPFQLDERLGDSVIVVALFLVFFVTIFAADNILYYENYKRPIRQYQSERSDIESVICKIIDGNA